MAKRGEIIEITDLDQETREVEVHAMLPSGEDAYFWKRFPGKRAITEDAVRKDWDGTSVTDIDWHLCQ